VGYVGFAKGSKTPEDYFLANRGIGAIVMLFTFIASNFSAFFFMGFAGAGYRIGYSYYPMMAFGTAFAALAFYFIGFRTWRLGKLKGYVTPPEMIGDLTQSNSLKLLFMVVLVFFTLPYVAIQPMGAGYILDTLTDGQIPYFYGAVILTVFIVIYVFVGGMRTVALTDLIQGVLMFGLMILAVWVISADLGGLAEANAKVFEQKPELFSRQGGNNYFTPQKWFSLMILWLFCVPMFPHMFMRFFMSKDTYSFKFSTFFYALIPCFLFILPVIIGVIGHLSFPGLEGKETDRIIPMMLMEHTPLWVAALILTGALAAFMSSLDSQLLAISTMFTRDIYLSFIDHKASMGLQVILGRICVATCALIGLLIAAYAEDSIFAIVKMAFTGYAALFPTTLAVLYFKNVPAWICVLSILSGECLLVTLTFNWIPTAWTLGFDPIIPVMLVTSLVILVGTAFSPRTLALRKIG
jgi:SSS family solute:Na+ symporter